MILPIYTYGAPILRATTQPVGQDSPELQKLIDDMLQTMHGAEGIGLAAPQVGRTERLFVVDLGPLVEELEAEGEEVPTQPMVFINAQLIRDEGEPSEFEEGCLSIPDIREYVKRPESVSIRYLDRNFEAVEARFDGMLARVVQHEYDHVEGVLFVDRISPFRRRLLRRRLRDMAEGKVEADYPIAGVHA